MNAMLMTETRQFVWQEFVVVGELEEAAPAEGDERQDDDGVDWCDWWAMYSGMME